MALAFLDGLFDIQRADHAVFGGRDGQVDEGDGFFFDRQRFAGGGPLAAFGAPGGGLVGVAAEAAAAHGADLGQQGRQGARGGGLGGAALAADQHAADARVNGVEDQGAPHAFLSDDGSEGIDGGHK